MSRRRWARPARWPLALLAALLWAVPTFLPTAAYSASAKAVYAVDVPAASFAYSAGAGHTVGGTVVLSSTGSAWAFVTTTSTTRRVSFQLATTRCEGAPVVAVAVDGTTLLSREIDGRGDYAVVGSWPAGRHQLTFRFVNDHHTAGCDPNLYLSAVRMFAFADGTVQGAVVRQDAVVDYVDGDPVLHQDGMIHLRQDSQGATSTFLRIASFPCVGPLRLVVSIDGVPSWSGTPPRTDDGWGMGELTLPGTVPNGVHDIAFAVTGIASTTSCNSLFDVWAVAFTGVV